MSDLKQGFPKNFRPAKRASVFSGIYFLQMRGILKHMSVQELSTPFRYRKAAWALGFPDIE
jgi:hypothetical protein